MDNAIVRQDQAALVEQVVIGGDLSKLNAEGRVTYYNRVCQSLGLNPLTKPFDYITLNGRLTLYAKRDATDQLRKRDRVSVTIVGRERLEDVYVVTARATTPDGRADESIGAVSIGSLKGDALANALMKAETKSKRRVTLSIVGLGWLDETEIETIPDARPVAVEEQAENSQVSLESLAQRLRDLRADEKRLASALGVPVPDVKAGGTVDKMQAAINACGERIAALQAEMARRQTVGIADAAAEPPVKVA